MGGGTRTTKKKNTGQPQGTTAYRSHSKPHCWNTNTTSEKSRVGNDGTVEPRQQHASQVDEGATSLGGVQTMHSVAGKRWGTEAAHTKHTHTAHHPQSVMRTHPHSTCTRTSITKAVPSQRHTTTCVFCHTQTDLIHPTRCLTLYSAAHVSPSISHHVAGHEPQQGSSTPPANEHQKTKTRARLASARARNESKVNYIKQIQCESSSDDQRS
mmetsp:Transcript_27569/g.70230  ORF Transcript_27569/g.70230 Transcript_27569/m.70230 type:complete len:212 (-) Transcript_27569:486-1121(-)